MQQGRAHLHYEQRRQGYNQNLQGGQAGLPAVSVLNSEMLSSREPDHVVGEDQPEAGCKPLPKEAMQEVHCVCQDPWARGLGPADGAVHGALAFSAWDSHQESTRHVRGLQKHCTQNTW